MFQVIDLRKYFPLETGLFRRERKWQRAVDGVTFSIETGQTLGLVGESGSGKTTTGRCMLRLIEPTGGKVLFNGDNVLDFGGAELRRFRQKAAMVFQDPDSSLNPWLNVESIVTEPLKIHRVCDETEIRQRVAETVEMVGLKKEWLTRHPHEFSGGQKQRICIVRAIIAQPDLVLLDEPTSALDVSVGVKILKLLKELQETLKISYLLISHDMSCVRYVAHKVAVMYMGKIVEIGQTSDVFERQCHPYVKALVDSVPIPDPKARKNRKFELKEYLGQPTPAHGCLLQDRCRLCTAECKKDEPPLIDVGGGHKVACHQTDRLRT